MDARSRHANACWVLFALLMGTLTAWWITDNELPLEPHGRRSRVLAPTSIRVQLGAVNEMAMPAASAVPAERRGAWPGVVASYRRTIGFRQYARAMTELGGRFVLWNRQTRKLLAVVNPISRTLETPDTRLLQGFSSRARDFTEEEALKPYRDPKRHATAVLLLVPQVVDEAILAGVKRGLTQIGLTLQDLTTVHGVYTIEQHDLVLTLTSGTSKTGKHVPLHAVCNLSAAMRKRS